MRFHAAALQIAVRLGLGHAAGGLQQRLGVPDDLLILLGGLGGRARLLRLRQRLGGLGQLIAADRQRQAADGGVFAVA